MTLAESNINLVMAIYFLVEETLMACIDGRTVQKKGRNSVTAECSYSIGGHSSKRGQIEIKLYIIANALVSEQNLLCNSFN